MATKKADASDRKEVRIGMLGYGFMGKCHSHVFKVIPYIYPELNIVPRLLLLCGRNEEKVRHAAARYGFEEYCTDWREAVGDPRIDIFDNCGPDPLHPEPCIAALENGKHVICEKPLAVSADDARQMRDAAAKAPGKAMCVFNYRFFPAVHLARDLIAAGRLGKLYHMRVNYMQMAGHDPSLPPEQVWYSAWPHSGVLQGIGSHAIDQCRFLVGEVKSVMARVGAFNASRAIPSAERKEEVVDEATAAILEFENGAMGVMLATALATGRKNVLSWEINGSQGSLRWNLEHPNSLLACLEGAEEPALSGFTEICVTDNEHPYASAWWPSGHTLGWEHAHIIEKAQFLGTIASSANMSSCLATFEDGYRVSVIIAAMKESSRSGKRVVILY
jgi:predicted dehydrogenase